MSILKQLSSYSWYAKAVTAMAAFALEYGNFWHLCQVPRDDMLGRSLAVLNHVHAFERKRKDLSEYNLLVKNIFEIVKSLVELESIFKHGYGLKDVPSLTTAMHDFPVYVYWVVLALVSCACHIDILLGTS
ncbi:protein SIEVE ELEMENT OCCLUSION B-like [Senna tora]|uniref:Protein SIEVE ELEMENT OCCLUSION B-like n=1 Tax=Senna tora TaxID=362788 RepID=A0A834SN40_9FABA|nr:protein SIEVE ELEMENT OCCLUSION B-like [Senna tora]